MPSDINSEIKKLQDSILRIEESIAEYLRMKYYEGVKKSLRLLESDLKYLSILANGAPINKEEDRKLMEFLRTHYDYLQKISVPA
ncbi:hypothetical protein [Nitrosopumilus adriaticus]|uniref:Uncharacterized protein n=1 Tax=Nitrosopumilus adriaticus TaxID=1580092 RepID=A0A0D5C412_9ARCH|nr:hypothetical protein [Nitrosopumilus adriaticus]AJW71544.1 hypothetical protein NADRNF5_1866 [Nitrosopumilus adriaticus]